MYTKEEENLIILSGIEQLTYRLRRILLGDFSSASPDFANNENLLIKTLSDGVYNKVKANFYNSDFRAGVLDGLSAKGIKCVTYFSDEYPEALKNTGAPPVTLYCKGDISLLKSNCFSVVGSRRTMPRVIAECKKISGELTKHFTVVSGIAEGADTAALTGALDAGGKVISVFANGLDRIYPAANANLAERICKEGLLISEYPPETLPAAYNFPVRNRIIAGLSRGTLVVSAAIRSGALITANYALEYDREVFAFPYNAGITSGAGCNGLIKKSAHLTENILDIFNEFGLDFNTPENKQPLSGIELAVYEAVKALGEAFLPAVAAKLGKLPHEIIPAISSLEIKGFVVSVGGNRYSAV